MDDLNEKEFPQDGDDGEKKAADLSPSGLEQPSEAGESRADTLWVGEAASENKEVLTKKDADDSFSGPVLSDAVDTVTGTENREIEGGERKEDARVSKESLGDIKEDTNPEMPIEESEGDFQIKGISKPLDGGEKSAESGAQDVSQKLQEEGESSSDEAGEESKEKVVDEDEQGTNLQGDPFREDMDWYVVHCYSGYELKAKKSLEERIKAHGMEDSFGQILVPQERVVEMVKGQKKTSNKKFYPGYILVQMKMTQDTWHLVKETPKITGFVGDAADPAPMTHEEIARILGQIEEGAASPRSRMSFQEGEQVKVIDGPFSDFNGTIEEVKPEKGKVKVLISIFGRATPVELDFFQVEKI